MQFICNIKLAALDLRASDEFSQSHWGSRRLTTLIHQEPPGYRRSQVIPTDYCVGRKLRRSGDQWFR